MELSWLQFITNAGGLAAVACLALWVIYKQDARHSQSTTELTKAFISTVVANAEVLAEISQVIQSRQETFVGLNSLLDRNVDLQGNVIECLKDNIKVNTELQTLLVDINGGTKKKKRGK